MICLPFSCKTAHGVKGTEMKSVCSSVDWVHADMIKFIIRNTQVSKSFHLKRYIYSCEN